jgi:hypothetical protein
VLALTVQAVNEDKVARDPFNLIDVPLAKVASTAE